MAQWMVEYTYDDQTALRDEVRPAHREYLAKLADAGVMLAFGRFDDEHEPGAMLIVDAEAASDVEAIVARDPFTISGLIPQFRVRRWAGTWGAARP